MRKKGLRMRTARASEYDGVYDGDDADVNYVADADYEEMRVTARIMVMLLMTAMFMRHVMLILMLAFMLRMRAQRRPGTRARIMTTATIAARMRMQMGMCTRGR